MTPEVSPEVSVNQSEPPQDIARLRVCVNRGRPFGSASWVEQIVVRLGLESTLRTRGRPPGAASKPDEPKEK